MLNKYVNEEMGLVDSTTSGALNPCHHAVFSTLGALRTFPISEVHFYNFCQTWIQAQGFQFAHCPPQTAGPMPVRFWILLDRAVL